MSSCFENPSFTSINLGNFGVSQRPLRSNTEIYRHYQGKKSLNFKPQPFDKPSSSAITKQSKEVDARTMNDETRIWRCSRMLEVIYMFNTQIVESMRTISLSCSTGYVRL